jgi:hypothetical protein
MLTGGGEEDRDKDNYVRQWWRKDAMLASTGGGEEDRDDNNDNHCARRWRREDVDVNVYIDIVWRWGQQ